jgi:hypothetical protein
MEHDRRRKHPVPPKIFYQHLRRQAAIAFLLMLGALAIGVLGYRYIVGDKDWYDALLDASMLLGGMGPITTTFPTHAAKVFASIYALFSGLVILASAGIFVSPIVHRLLVRIHADVEESADHSG